MLLPTVKPLIVPACSIATVHDVVAADLPTWSDVVARAWESGDLQTGLVVYVVGIVLMTAWEEWALPWLRRSERTTTITPWTADTPVPLPELDALHAKERHYVGTREGRRQFITLHRPDENDIHVDEVWSAYYGTDVWVVCEPITRPPRG